MAKKLITVGEFKTYKDINTSEDDNRIDSIIISVSAFIKSFCGRSFIDYATTDKVEYHNAKDDVNIFLEEFPIISITEAAYTLDGWVTETILDVSSQEYFLDEEIGLITSGTTVPFSYGSVYNHNNFKVTYTAGYADTPDDLKIAAMDLVEYYRSEEYTPSKSMQNMSVENVISRETRLPAHISRVLQLYRRLN